MEQEQQNKTLYVKMLGGFSMSWGGRQIAIGPKGKDSQFVRLLEAVIHSGSEGVTRSQMEDILFEDR